MIGRGDRVRTSTDGGETFSSTRGTVEYVEPCRTRIWVRSDFTGMDECFDSSEVRLAEPAPLPGAAFLPEYKWGEQRKKCYGCRYLVTKGTAMSCMNAKTRKWGSCIAAREQGAPCGPDALLFEAVSATL